MTVHCYFSPSPWLSPARGERNVLESTGTSSIHPALLENGPVERHDPGKLSRCALRSVIPARWSRRGLASNTRPLPRSLWFPSSSKTLRSGPPFSFYRVSRLCLGSPSPSLGGGNLPAGGPFVGLYRGAQDRCVAQQRAAIDQSSHRCTIAIVVLQESVTALIMSGTVLVVIGIALVSWKAEKELPSFRWWHLLLPVGAACLTGMNHPMRRYALSLSNEPLFFSAFMGVVSLVGFAGYMTISSQEPRLVWNRKAIWPFLCTGVFETVSIVLIITALSVGPVVVIAPIAATYPVWSLIGAKLFLKDVEQISLKVVVGILSVVAGTVAINLGR